MFPLTRRGTKVGLREFDVGDAAAAHQWTGDAEATRYVPLGPLTPDGTRSYVHTLTREAKEQPRTTYTLAIHEADDDARAAIGAIALSIDSVEHGRGELGFMLRPSAWGRGFGSEAVALMVEFGMDSLGLHRIWAVCDPRNVASQRVMERCGLRYEGCLRGDMLLRGERCDSLLYAVVAADRADAEYL